MMLNPYKSTRYSPRFFLALVLASGNLILSPCRSWAQSEETKSSSAAIDFDRQVLPLLNRNCVACHNAKKAEGGLSLESFVALQKGGDSGPLFEDAKTEASLLLSRVIANDDTAMPPKDNKVGAKQLTDSEIAILKTWIVQGAKASLVSAMATVSWQPIPDAVRPIYSIATSMDEQYIACGYGNRAVVYRSSDESDAGQALIDPSVGFGLGTATQATDIDLIQSIAFSPDSQRIATGGYKTVKIWKRGTDALPFANGLFRQQGLVSIAPDGKRAAGQGLENSILVRDVASGATLVSLLGHTAPISSLAWSPDGSRLVSSDQSGVKLYWKLGGEVPKSIVWKDSNNAWVKRIEKGTSPWRQVIVLSNELLGSLDSEGSLAWWRCDGTSEGDSFTKVDSPRSPSGVVAIVASEGSDKPIVAASADGTIRVGNRDVSANWSKEWQHGQTISAVAISEDASRVTSVGVDGVIKLWSLPDGKELQILSGDYQLDQSFAQAGRNNQRQKAKVDRLVSKISDLKKVAEKELEAKKKVEETRNKTLEAVEAKKKEVEAAAATVSEAEKALQAAQQALADAMKKVEEVTADLDKKRKSQQEVEKGRDAVMATLSSIDQSLASASDGLKRAQEAVPTEEARIESEKVVLASLGEIAVSIEKQKKASLSPVLAMAIAPNNERVVTVHDDGKIRVYESNGQPVAHLESHFKIDALQFTPSGTLVGSGQHALAECWDVSLPWRLERTIGGPDESLFSDRLTAIDFSPDSSRIAVGGGLPSRTGEVRILDARTGKSIREWSEVHSDTVLGLRFAPDGRSIASCAADKTIRLFDVERGTLLRTFEGHTHHVLAIAWQDEGHMLASAGADKTIKTWNVETGEPIATLAGASKEVSALAFLGQSSTLLASSSDGQIRLYENASGNAKRSFAGATGSLDAISVLPNRKRVVAGGQAGNLWIWDLDKGQLLRTLPPR